MGKRQRRREREQAAKKAAQKTLSVRRTKGLKKQAPADLKNSPQAPEDRQRTHKATQEKATKGPESAGSKGPGKPQKLLAALSYLAPTALIPVSLTATSIPPLALLVAPILVLAAAKEKDFLKKHAMNSLNIQLTLAFTIALLAPLAIPNLAFEPDPTPTAYVTMIALGGALLSALAWWLTVNIKGAVAATRGHAYTTEHTIVSAAKKLWGKLS